MVKALPVGCIAGAISRPHNPEGAAICWPLHAHLTGAGDSGRGVQPGAAGTQGGFGGPELSVSFCVIWIQILRNQRTQNLAKGLHSTSAKVSLLSRKESALTDSHEFVTSSGTGKELLKF